MGTVPTVPAWSTNAKITGSKLQQLSDGLTWDFATKPILGMTQGTAQAMSGAFTSLLWDAEVIDRDGQHSLVTNTDRIIIGSTPGWYRVSAVITFNAVTTAGSTRRGVVGLSQAGGAVVAQNGTQVIIPGSTTLTTVVIPPSVPIQATNAADYIVIQGWHDGTTSPTTGVSATFRSSVMVEWLGS